MMRIGQMSEKLLNPPLPITQSLSYNQILQYDKGTLWSWGEILKIHNFFNTEILIGKDSDV